MNKSTTDTLNKSKFTRKCLLHEIKKCNKIIHTNRINQKFCCDDHRYIWHNNMKALFKRMALLEESTRKAFSDLWYALKKNIEATKALESKEYDRESYALEQRERND